MQIPKENFEALVPAELRVGFHTGQALYRIHRYYCKPLTGMNKCPMKCEDCQDDLSSVFSRIQEAEDNVMQPNGLLVWLLRDKRAEISERSDKQKAKTAKDWLSRPIYETSPFESLLSRLGV